MLILKNRRKAGKTGLGKTGMGRIGEDAASAYLKKEGYKIIEKNYKNKYGEIDLICKDKNIFVFVEVKTRQSNDFGGPEAAIDFLKIRQITRISEMYLFFKKIIFPARIDAVCVVLDKNLKVKQIKHYKEIS